MYFSFVFVFLAACFLQEPSSSDSSLRELVARIEKMDFPDVAKVKAAGQDYMVELNKFKSELDAAVRLLARKAPEHPEIGWTGLLSKKQKDRQSLTGATGAQNVSCVT